MDDTNLKDTTKQNQDVQQSAHHNQTSILAEFDPLALKENNYKELDLFNTSFNALNWNEAEFVPKKQKKSIERPSFCENFSLLNEPKVSKPDSDSITFSDLAQNYGPETMNHPLHAENILQGLCTKKPKAIPINEAYYLLQDATLALPLNTQQCIESCANSTLIQSSDTEANLATDSTFLHKSPYSLNVSTIDLPIDSTKLDSPGSSRAVVNQSSSDIHDLIEENRRLRFLAASYEQIFTKVEDMFNRSIAESEKKHMKMKSEQDSIINTAHLLSEAYKYTYSQYEDLTTRFDALRCNIEYIQKNNSDLRVALDLSASKINDFLQSLNEQKMAFQTQVSSLQATHKLNLNKIASLESTVHQLTTNKAELSEICEELFSMKK